MSRFPPPDSNPATDPDADVAAGSRATQVRVPTQSQAEEVLPDALDLTDELPSDSSPGLEMGARYDPRPQKDGARRTIAYLLIGILAAVVIFMLLALLFGRIQASELKEFGVVLGPLVTLVSAATGFYYGTKSR